jgi:hypothetical protein
MLGVTKTDRIMWFSMWFLASIASFGIAFFPMIYLMIKRRNNHFKRHNRTERKNLDLKKDSVDTTTLDLPIERNTKIWTLSIFLIFPIFIITYFLSKDLITHEKLQQKKYATIFHSKQFKPQEVSVKKYVLLTLFTLGIGIIYWLYKTMNMYNSHFIHQEKIEGELTKIEETKTKS